jgi:hypothetical protein
LNMIAPGAERVSGNPHKSQEVDTESVDGFASNFGRNLTRQISGGRVGGWHRTKLVGQRKVRGRGS